VGAAGIVTASGLDVSGVVTCTTLSTSSNVSASSSITVGDSFLLNTAVGLGTTDTTGRNAGVGTAKGTLIYNATTKGVEVYDGTQWINGLSSLVSATGGSQDTTSRSGYIVHTFTSPGTFTVLNGDVDVEYLVVAGGGGGGKMNYPVGRGAGGGGAGGYRTGSLPVTPGDYPVTIGGGGGG
jgi:hypothetical protein